MRIVTRLLTIAVLVAAATIASGRAQGPGRNTNWPTVGADAQRTSWMRNEMKVSAASMAKPEFQLLWKAKLENQPAQLNALTQPLLLQNIISHKGFKALAFVGGSADVVYAIDYDLNRVYWKQRLTTAARVANPSLTCPGGLTAITRAVTVAPGQPGGRGGPGGPPPGRGPGPPPPPPQNRGGINPGSLPITAAVYAVSSGGMVHFLNPHIGTDIQPPIKFLPPNAKVAGLILVDNTLYAATEDNCGGAPNGISAIDFGSDAKTITRWQSDRGAVVGTTGPTFGFDGTIYAATAQAVVALEPKSLKLRDHFTAESAFTTAPVAFRVKDRDLLVAANSDGRLYLLDARTLGGPDHKTPLARSAQYAGASGAVSSALATWEESNGARWILAPSSTGIVSFKVVDRPPSLAGTGSSSGAASSLTLEQGWTSRDIPSPLPPTVLNDVVFAVASGLPPADAKATAAERVKRAGAAVLYALDGRTGKELWNSGNAITSFAPGIAPSAGDSQVYVVTYDGTVYAFGLPQER